MGRFVCFFLLSTVFWGISPYTVLAACKPQVAKIVSLQGQVEVVRSGRAVWRLASLDEHLCGGDRLRIEAHSRAAVLLQNETLLRLDAGTVLTLTHVKSDKPSFIELLKGAIHVITRVPRSLEIRTPFVDGAVEGTEFVMRVSDKQSEVWVFEGKVRLGNTHGALLLNSGEAAIAKQDQAPIRRLLVTPNEAVAWTLYYPPIVDTGRFTASPGGASDPIAHAISFTEDNNLSSAIAMLDNVAKEARDADYHVLRASLLLSVGRVDEVLGELDAVLATNPQSGDAYALQSIIYLVQHENQRALELAQQAAQLSKDSSIPQIALSYVYQSRYELSLAIKHTSKALELRPDDALAWARMAELQLAQGDLDQALSAAHKAVALNPRLERTQSVLGFAYLTRIDADAAQLAFEQAIQNDSTAPMARLGLGLANIRRGGLDEGVEEIEIAASLDPENALIRSYLGKAYYEQRRNNLAATEYERAKALDPKDPTPWFYDAIRKQTENRPIEALHDLQTAIALNGNRAVYRSRLLLDQDLAARSASLARVYHDLGFEQRALSEGWRSVSIDPSDYSAHRFLADVYRSRPRHEVARVSELLQSQLLQPLNINLLQPQLGEANLQVLEGAGSSSAAYGEFNPLFVRDGIALQMSGVVGNNDTFSNEFVASGLRGPFSISFGQYHYATNGFRENNDLEHNIYNLFAQGSISPNFNLQAEYRWRETRRGDLELRFDPDDYNANNREQLDRESFRIGSRYSPSVSSDILISGFYAERDEREETTGESIFRNHGLSHGYQVEVQHLFRHDHFNTIAGGGRYDVDSRVSFEKTISPLLLPFTQQFSDSVKHDNAYLYANLMLPEKVTWTFGLTYDHFFDETGQNINKFNPKLGVQWDITDQVRIRSAYLKTVKRSLIANQTIEPTQIAGFNQFFDDSGGTKAEQYGIGLDALLNPRLYSGIEYSRRNLLVPGVLGGDAVYLDRHEDLYRTYLYWMPHRHWALSLEANYERFKRATSDPSVQFNGDPFAVDTLTIPLTLRYFQPNGFFAEVGESYVQQKFAPSPSSLSSQQSDDFFVLDASVGYRLAKRHGMIRLVAKNLLDKSFFYQDLNVQQADLNLSPRFIPDRILFLQATFVFN